MAADILALPLSSFQYIQETGIESDPLELRI